MVFLPRSYNVTFGPEGHRIVMTVAPEDIAPFVRLLIGNRVEYIEISEFNPPTASTAGMIAAASHSTTMPLSWVTGGTNP